MSRMVSVAALLVAAAIAGGGVWAWFSAGTGSGGVSADMITLGRTLYAENCVSCHGVKLEGQPNWKQRRPNGRLPAPPHDASGHTWHHSDSAIFRVTKEGSAAVAGGGYESDMPGFSSVLSDDEIRAVLAFIKSTWPERIRAVQEKMNVKDKRAAQ